MAKGSSNRMLSLWLIRSPLRRLILSTLTFYVPLGLTPRGLWSLVIHDKAKHVRLALIKSPHWWKYVINQMYSFEKNDRSRIVRSPRCLLSLAFDGKSSNNFVQGMLVWEPCLRPPPAPWFCDSWKSRVDIDPNSQKDVGLGSAFRHSLERGPGLHAPVHQWPQTLPQTLDTISVSFSAWLTKLWPLNIQNHCELDKRRWVILFTSLPLLGSPTSGPFSEIFLPQR